MLLWILEVNLDQTEPDDKQNVKKKSNFFTIWMYF